MSDDVRYGQLLAVWRMQHLPMGLWLRNPLGSKPDLRTALPAKLA